MTTVEGLDRLMARWGAIPERVRSEVADAMEKVAPLIVADMRKLAPKDTGTLAASINWTWGNAPKGSLVIGSFNGNAYGGLRITIYAGGEATATRQARSSGDRARDRHRSGYFDSNYARYQEFGTINMAANPFFFPVWRVWKPRVKSRIRAAIRRGLRGG